MAQTEKGIIYPYDYNEVADVPADLKALAESIDALLNNYSLNTDSGNKIVLEMNSTTYKIKAVLKDKDDNVISTSNEIDLPLENMITNITYNDQKLTLTHQDGQTTEVSIADLISDLASKEEVEELQSQVDDLETLVETELDSNTEEGTEIDVEDSAEYRGKVEVKGNTYQKQLSGKNLWGGFEFTKTQYGVEHKQNSDGSFVVNGTATNKSYSMTSGEASSNNRLITLPAGTYCLSGGSPNVRIQVCKTNGLAICSTNSSDIFSIDNDTQVFVRTYVLENITVNNETLYAQLEEGSAATDYEPYCGGQASPNPDYPQEIEVVTGNNVIKNCGKNLFDKNNANKLNGGYIDISSNKILASNKARCIYIPIKENCSYTVSKKVTNYSHFRIATTQDTPIIGSTVSDIQVGDGNTTSLTLTSSLKSRYLVVWWGRVDYDNEDEVLSSIQIEEGTTATSYEPYREENFNLNLGNIELCKIGDHEDIPFKNVVGDENYNSSLTEGAWYKKCVVEKTTDVSGSTGKTISNMLNNSNVYSYYGGTVSNKTITYDSAISGTNTIYYVLETPTYTQITDTTLIAQLEALRKAKWFKGINHWWTETENLEPNLKGTYKQSNNLRLQALEQAVVALGGV